MALAAQLLAAPYGAALRAGMAALEAGLLPDVALRAAVRAMSAMRLRSSCAPTAEAHLAALLDFVKALKLMPIAINTEEANVQHYEVPTEFYKLVLGKHLKYSSCLYPSPASTLDEAEEHTLALYCERAQLQDGQAVLDLGCGWGSLSLYIAARYPGSSVTSLSNSSTQRAYIEECCRQRGIKNLEVVTANVVVFEAGTMYDRILSIEMFEHMKNYQKLLHKVSVWLKPDGLLFIHIFTHKQYAYHFETANDDDWMGRHFFTGGTMPSDDLLLYFQDDVAIVDHWRASGKNYQFTSEAWLRNFDKNIHTIRPILAKTYGEDQLTKWTVYWRTFFIAVAELFGFSNGEEWLISHYLFKRK
eukprot:SM000123S25872  [mRNA]  locus=s123:330872:333590:- [translate_table: standard]